MGGWMIWWGWTQPYWFWMHTFPLDNFDKIRNFIIDNFDIKDNFEINEMEQISNVYIVNIFSMII